MEQLDELMATKVMGWHLEPRTPPIGREVWCNSDGRFQIDEVDWHPDTDLNQAMMCAENETSIRRIEIVKDILHPAPTHWALVVNGVMSELMTRAHIPLAICEVIQGAMK